MFDGCDEDKVDRSDSESLSPNAVTMEITWRPSNPNKQFFYYMYCSNSTAAAPKVYHQYLIQNKNKYFNELYNCIPL